MCVFCAAIPVAMAAGARFRQSQIEKFHQAEREGRPPFRSFPVGKATLVVIAGLAVASAVVHTQTGWGI